MYKLHDFSVIQILREINFRESRSSETAVFAIFEALSLVNLVNSRLPKVEKLKKKSKFRASKCVQMVDFPLLQGQSTQNVKSKSGIFGTLLVFMLSFFISESSLVAAF